MPFLYKAIECHADFVIHCQGIALGVDKQDGAATVMAKGGLFVTKRMFPPHITVTKNWDLVVSCSKAS